MECAHILCGVQNGVKKYLLLHGKCSNVMPEPQLGRGSHLLKPLSYELPLGNATATKIDLSFEW